MSTWNEAGHKIGNHTYTHPYYNSQKVTLDDFEAEFLKNDSIIKHYSNYYPYFRYPYLKEGNIIDGLPCHNEHWEKMDIAPTELEFDGPATLY